MKCQYYQKYINQITLNHIRTKEFSFTNTGGPHFNFVGCESLLESNSPVIVVLFEKNKDDSIDSTNLSMRSYLPLTQKNYITHMHSLAVYVKERLPFAQDLSLQNSVDLLHSLYYFIFL